MPDAQAVGADMFDLDAVDLESLIGAIDRSGISEFSLTTGDGEIRVSKNPGGPEAAPHVAPESSMGAAAGDISPLSEPVSAQVAAPAREPVATPDAAGRGQSEDQIEIRTPLLGIFYRAPEPGAPPFVEVGDHVEPDTTVAIIEVMKVFTAVQAGMIGVIAEVLANDRELVEHDQPLFRVKTEV